MGRWPASVTCLAGFSEVVPGGMVNYRAAASAALLAVMGAMFAAVPAIAATPPSVRLSGELVQVADQEGSGFAAVRLAGGAHVPITAQSVKSIASGSTVTLDVAVPADVRVAAAANRTLTIQGVDGKEIAVRLRSSDLAAASDGSPEVVTSAIGRATVAEAMAPGTPALEVSNVVAAAADPVSTYTRTTRNVYVAVVTPAGATPGPSVDVSRIQAQVTGASSYWDEVTAGGVKLTLAATIGARYTSEYNCSDPWGMWDEAKLKVGFPSNVPLPPNTSVVIALPKSSASSCGYGLGTIGASPNHWGYLYVADDVWPVLAHELGHNMSLQHANALLCPTAADSAYSTTTWAWTASGCEEDPYGDGQDVMAASPTSFAPFLSAPQSLRTGIIPPGAATVIDTAGTRIVTILPLAARTGIRTAEVVNPTNGVSYYVEYRTPAAPDTLNVFGVKTGVRVLRFNPATGATVLLDPSPTGQSRDPDPTLPVGGTFVSYDGRVRITTVSVNNANAVVSVTIAASASTAPGAPGAVAAVAGDSSARVSWTAPSSNGGAPINRYTVTAAPGGRTVTTTGTTTATVTGLSNGASYTFTVTATNTVGTGPASARSSAITPTSRVQRYITRVYSDLFNRAPDPGGLATWTAALNRGTPRVAVANAITYSSEYRSRLIAGSYNRYLGRSPDPGGLRTWLGAMNRGWTISQMESGFIASGEYYAKAGSTDAGWVRKLYTDVLGRSAAISEVVSWTAQLRRGMGRQQVAMGFLLSTERLNTVVDGHYRHLLRRGVDPAGQRTWVAILQVGGRDEAIIGGIIASQEYYGRP